MSKRAALALLATVIAAPLLLAAPPACAEDWPQWRGPRADGIGAATGLPASWSKTENVRWRLPLPGPGPSTPIVVGDLVLLTAGNGERVMLIAVGTDGEERWRRVLDERDYDARSGESNAAAPSPSSDGERVFTFTGTGVLASHGLDGSERWRRDLSGGAGRFDMYFGMASTPVLEGGRLIVALLDGKGQRVVAVEAATGETVWQIERPTDARAECLHAYTSPVVFGSGDGRQLVVHGADYTTGHALGDGAELWRFSGFHGESYNPSLRLVASPVAVGELLVVPTAKRGPVFGLAPAGARGTITEASDAYGWRQERVTPDVPSPVVADGIVYLSREDGSLVTLDASSGEQIYAERVHGAPHRASPVLADGKLFMIGMDGVVSVVRAGRDYQLLAQNAMEERTAASPAIAGGVLYLRTYEALYAIAGAPEAAAATSAGR